MIRWIAGVLLLLTLSGAVYYYLRYDPLRAEVDRRWPPVTADQQRQAAIDSAASTIKALATPNVAAGADVATLQQIAFDEIKSKGITNLVLAADRQLLRMTAGFDVTLTPDDLPKDSEKRSLVATLAPHVVGEVELYLTAAASMSDAPQRTLVVKLLPAVKWLRIDKLMVNGSYDVTAAADAIALILNGYADNLTGTLSSIPFMNVTLPATLQDGFDPSGPIKVDLKEAPGLKPILESQPIKSPFRLGAATLLIDGDKVIAIAELIPLDKPPAKTDPTNGSFDDVKAAFKKALNHGLGIADPLPGVWVALGKALIAHALDSAFAQAQPCLEASGPIPTETFSAKIPTPDGSGISCTPTRDCTPSRDCTPTRECTPTGSCDLHVDTRDCSACLVHNPFGGCIVRGNDPVCEASKGAQNVGYAAAKAACEGQKSAAKADCERIKEENRLDCERLKTQEKFQCEAEKEGQRLGCETEKGAIVALHRTGNIGNVDGKVEGTGSIRLCFRDVAMSSALDKLTLTLTASGSAALGTHFKFVPLDVGGHILCPFEWTADKNITTSIPLQSIAVNVNLTREAKAGTLTYRGTLDELPIKLHFQPSPLSLILQNVNFDLACPVAAGLINGLTLGLAPFIPELLKDYTYKLAPMTFSFAPDLPAQSILNRSVKPKLSETSLALIVSGTQ